MLTRKTVIMAGIEATYGTDPALSAAANGLLASDVNIDIKGETLKRDIVRDTLSPIGHVIGMKEISLSFKTEIKGTNLGSTPEMDSLLQSCGFGTAAHAGTAVITYTVVSSEALLQSASIYVYVDGNRHKVTGARGNVKFNFEAGKFGVAEWDFSGIYNAVEAVAIPDLTGLVKAQPPICYGAGFQISGFSPVTSKVEIDLGNKVVRRDDLNALSGVKGFIITGREPKIKFDADAVLESSNPFWGDWAGSVIDTFAIQAGTTAGNIALFTGNFEFESNKYGDKDGVSKFEVNAALVSSNPDTQNDELQIVFK